MALSSCGISLASSRALCWQFLPNCHSLLSSASSLQSCLNLGTNESGKIVSLEDRQGLSLPECKVKDSGDGVENGVCIQDAGLRLSDCPVCGKKVRGGDYSINLHLDLTRTRYEPNVVQEKNTGLLELLLRAETEPMISHPQ